MLGEFFLPFLVIDSEKIGDRFMVDIQLFQVEIVWARQPANGRFERAACLFAAINDPFEHSHVLAEARPEEFSILAFAEPVHVEDERRIGETFSDVHPMPEIIADVVSAEGQHRHRIAPDFADSSRRGCGCL